MSIVFSRHAQALEKGEKADDDIDTRHGALNLKSWRARVTFQVDEAPRRQQKQYAVISDATDGLRRRDATYLVSVDMRFRTADYIASSMH